MMETAVRAADRGWKVFWVIPALLLLGTPSRGPAADSSPLIRFTDVTKDAGLYGFRGVQGDTRKDHIIEVMGGGAAFLDYDGDGNLDVLLIRGSTIEQFSTQGGDLTCALFRGDGKGRFSDVTQEAGLTRRGWGQGVAVADYNGDGRPDIFVAGYGGNLLYRSQGGKQFEEVGSAAGVSESPWSLGAAFGDLDGDHDLDLYVANYLQYPLDRLPKVDASWCNYRGFTVFCGPRGLFGARDSLFLNDGRGGFRDVAEDRNIDPDKLYGLGVVATDFDNDGKTDIFVANDLTANLFYRNLGNGDFEEVAVLNGVAFSDDGIEEGSMGIDVADINGDGWLDLFYTNSSYESNSFLINNGDGSFTNMTNASGHGQSSYLYVGWGTSFGDLDNDGLEDLFVANGHLYPEADEFEMGLEYRQRWLVYMNQGGGKFEEAGERFGLTRKEASRGLALGDYDNDGDLDVVINNLDGPPTLLRNDGGNKGNWLVVRAVGRDANRSAIGTRLIAHVGGRRLLREIRSGSGYLSQNDLRAHFGLGAAEKVDELEIRWPWGDVDRLSDVKANQSLVVTAEPPR